MIMDFEKFTFKQVEENTIIKPFDCGDADLNGFLFDDSKKYLEAMLAVTYILEDNEANKTVAYYCLLNDKIELDPSGCRFLTVDAYKAAIPFYEKCGFNFLSEKDVEEDTRAMYFDLMYYKK